MVTLAKPAGLVNEVDMLEAISVQNYRTFAKKNTFEIAPITLLVGANSSGKSSITRLLPLFGQSISFRTAAPILWVSEDFDYGSFSDNVHRHNSGEPIVFSFSCSLNQDSIRRVYSPNGYVDIHPDSCDYEVSVFGDNERTFLQSLNISMHGHEVCFNFKSDGELMDIIFDGRVADWAFKDRRIHILQDLFPTFYTLDKNSSPSLSGMRDFNVEAARTIRAYAHQNTTTQNIQAALGGGIVANREAMRASLKSKLFSKKSLRESYIPDSSIDRVWLFFFLANISSIISSVQQSLSPDILSGGYLAPIRASAKRYYRRQELAIDQVDPSGDNLAMYLNSLSQSEMNSLNEDMLKFFDHSIQVKRGEGHISLRLEEKGEPHSDNLADVGFGFSQLIPVIAQIHAARKTNRLTNRLAPGPRGRKSPIVAIEQPELHLHPAYQSRLGSYFVSAAKRQNSADEKLRFLIETHSEPLVNEIASLVGRGEIAASDVKLYLFAATPGEPFSTVVDAEILPDGSIPDWPFGFFASGRLERRPS